MSDTNLAKTITTSFDEGVVVTRSVAGITVRLPRPRSAHHQLCVIAVVWEMLKSARHVDWTLNISELEEITLPLIAVMCAIDTNLGYAGKRLFVVGGSHTPSFAIKGV
jgi:hypothetical protein